MAEINAVKLEASLRKRLKDAMRKNIIPGGAVAVYQHGKLVCHIIEGYRNLDTKEPITTETMFRLASMTKPITGVAALIAIQNGWFDLYDKVSDYFPDYGNMYVGKLVNGEPAADYKSKTDMLIYHLLTHTNGITCDDEFGNIQKAVIPLKAWNSIRDIVDYCGRNTFLSFEPGTASAYTGYVSFDMIARIIELKSGLSYSDFVRENILDPLDINDITFSPTEEQWSRMATMHDEVFNGLVTENMGKYTFEHFPIEYTCAGASLAGTIKDYCKFAEMLRQKGSYNGKEIFKPEMLDIMTKPYVPEGTPGLAADQSWGLGVRVLRNHACLPDGCYGWSGAYGTHFWVDPQNDITAVYMKNVRRIGLMTVHHIEIDVMSSLE